MHQLPSTLWCSTQLHWRFGKRNVVGKNISNGKAVSLEKVTLAIGMLPLWGAVPEDGTVPPNAHCEFTRSYRKPEQARLISIGPQTLWDCGRIWNSTTKQLPQNSCSSWHSQPNKMSVTVVTFSPAAKILMLYWKLMSKQCFLKISISNQISYCQSEAWFHPLSKNICLAPGNMPVDITVPLGNMLGTLTWWARTHAIMSRWPWTHAIMPKNSQISYYCASGNAPKSTSLTPRISSYNCSFQDHYSPLLFWRDTRGEKL